MSRVLKRVGQTPERTTHIPKFDLQVPVEELTQPPLEDGPVTADPEVLLQEARARADQLLQQAQDHQEAVIEQATADAVKIRQQAYDEGYHEGYAAGEDAARTEGQAEYAKMIQVAQDIIAENKTRWERTVQSLHTVVSGVVKSAVQTLLQRELELAPADIQGMVQQLLDYVVEGARVRVLVNPTDYEATAGRFGQWDSDGYGEWHLSIVPEPSLSQGSCVLETAHGQVDATMETRIELVEQALTQVIERGLADELKQPS